GATNSVICSYDGDQTRIWKSPEQNDVTPSVIYMDRRGNKYVGQRAYDMAPQSPDNAATLFKRLMGTSTPIKLSAVDITTSPEECSSEILRALFGYLPEELRNDVNVGTVITVPAAFNQMQKNATMQAAELAGIGRVALMQEPVAAVMSVMKARNTDGIFVVYDLGGGTLDVAIAESIGGRINLHAHGGIAMCGGRDFDRVLVDSVIKPWLFENFDLPEDLATNSRYKSLLRLAAWAAERAKIELSVYEDAIISLDENDARVRDQSHQDIYIQIPVNRSGLDNLIGEKVQETIEATRETLANSGFDPQDVERIVFIGGPTNYKPLWDKVAFELGIPANTEVNPMTAVAEGAALFAESIEWGSENRSRKSNRGKVASSRPLDLAFNYTARTPDNRAKIVVQAGGQVMSGAEFQVDSLDTGWTSGRMSLENCTAVDVSLSKRGENTFKVFVFDAAGGSLTLEQDKIAITMTPATVDAIPASHSIGIEVLEKLGGTPIIEWLVRAGDQLPKEGNRVFKAGESLKAGSTGVLNFKLLEGESEYPPENRDVGLLKITGNDFDQGVIPAGGDLQCDFKMLDSGIIVLEVSVPSIGFRSRRNFYSRQEGQIDFSSEAVRIREEGEQTLQRLDDMNEAIDDPKLELGRKKLNSALQLDPEEPDTERAQEAMEGVNGARRLLAQVRKENQKEIRQMELDGGIESFNEHIRQFARPSEENAFDTLVRTAQRAIERNDRDFESHLNELKGMCFEILWRQDWFVVGKFKWMADSPHHFSDVARFKELVEMGLNSLQADDIDTLRQIVLQLWQIQIDTGVDPDRLDMANIIRG
ncbi:MAG: Hsp70 family protein, partial [Gemmatimonadetes bacterium]|nr:Hsp70 family protein [Gemmatimonadota bacterium]